MSDGHAPLAGVRVLDLTDRLGWYTGRLLALLGAEVLRIEDPNKPQGPPLPPAVVVNGRTVSFHEEFAHSGKVTSMLDLASEEGASGLVELVESTDVLLSGLDGRAPGGWADINPRLVHIVITAFGWAHTPHDDAIDDLLILAAGGLLHLGGYPDSGPIVPYGGQSYIAAGIYAASAAMFGLIQVERDGSGYWADVSAQETMAQALEDSLPGYVLTGKIRPPEGAEGKEAGTGTYACADGYVSMVAGRLGTARAWASLVDWLTSECVEATELLDDKWSDFAYRQTTEANARFRQIFEAFASTRSKETLYLDAQSRMIALSPVSDVSDLLANAQLRHRGFFSKYDHPTLHRVVTAPGPPFRFAGVELPVLGPAVEIGTPAFSDRGSA